MKVRTDQYARIIEHPSDKDGIVVMQKVGHDRIYLRIDVVSEQGTIREYTNYPQFETETERDDAFDLKDPEMLTIILEYTKIAKAQLRYLEETGEMDDQDEEGKPDYIQTMDVQYTGTWKPQPHPEAKPEPQGHRGSLIDMSVAYKAFEGDHIDAKYLLHIVNIAGGSLIWSMPISGKEVVEEIKKEFPPLLLDKVEFKLYNIVIGKEIKE